MICGVCVVELYLEFLLVGFEVDVLLEDLLELRLLLVARDQVILVEAGLFQ